jgi:DNA-binding PadR family transcriptional regulator
MAPATSKVEVVVLGLLAEEPLYGYDLLERFRTRSMGFWVEVGKASVYQVLKRLERAGSISGKAQGGTEGPDRRVFRITKLGRDRLRQGVVERLASARPYETDAGVALGFAHLLPQTEMRMVGETRERSVRDLLEAVTTELARTSGESGSDRAMSTAMLQQQAALAEAELAWLKTYRSALSKTRR